MTIAELIAKLEELPPDWHICATRDGGSLEFWNPDGVEYGWVFTYDNATRRLTRRSAGHVGSARMEF